MSTQPIDEGVWRGDESDPEEVAVERPSWCWESALGTETLHRDELVRLDDGTEGFVETVDLRPAVPRILVVQRVLPGVNGEAGSPMPDRWYIPANIVG